MRDRARAGVVLAVLGMLSACAGGGQDGLPTVIPTATAATTVVTTTTVATAAASSATAFDSSSSPMTPAPSTTAPGCAWPARRQVAQLVMVGVRGEDLAAVTDDVAALGVGGVIVMTWPDTASAGDLRALKTASAVPLLVAVDEEGGTVQRLRPLGLVPSAAAMATTRSPAEAEAEVAGHAAAVRALGFDVVFAPVVDVAPATGDGPLGSRTFGADPRVVSDYGAAYVRAWRSAGILPVLKHFPGHGRASADSHTGVAVTPPLAGLRSVDLVPYERLAGAGAGVMVGHLDVPGLTEDGVPASLSPAAVSGLLRGELGYRDALVFTDALGMGAVTGRFSAGEAAVRAVAAGVDMVLFTGLADAPAVIDALVAAVEDGRIPAGRLADALGHVLAAKGMTC